MVSSKARSEGKLDQIDHSTSWPKSIADPNHKAWHTLRDHQTSGFELQQGELQTSWSTQGWLAMTLVYVNEPNS